MFRDPIPLAKREIRSGLCDEGESSGAPWEAPRCQLRVVFKVRELSLSEMRNANC